MGFLALKDTGNTNTYVEAGKFKFSVPSLDKTLNPTGGYVQLKGYTISHTMGKKLNVEPNIAGSINRISSGSSNSIPIKLTAFFTKKPENVDRWSGTQITQDDLRNLSYVEQWSRSRGNIVMLFWYPETNLITDLKYGQVRDFYTSQLKVLYDIIWDRNLADSNKGYNTTTYGDIHYDIVMGGSIGTYSACAIPIIIENVTTKDEVTDPFIRVEIDAYAIENEAR